MVRKGQMHVMDAIAAVMILFFFAISGFDTAGGNDWQSFENQITATDISYTLKQTGHLENMVKNGESGSIQGSINGITQRDFSISGQIQGVAPNLDIGFYRRPPDRKEAPLDRLNSADNCFTEVQNTLEPRTYGEVLKTEASPVLNNNNDVTLYVGDYETGTSISNTEYDSIWIDRNDNCNFNQLDNPIDRKEIFEWGTGNYYEFFKVDNADDELVVTEADQMKRFQDTMGTKINGVRNRVKFHSFKLEEVPGETEELDFMIFPEKESIESIENQNLEDKVNNLIERKPVLFLANLDESLVETTFLRENGFRWKDLGFVDQTGSCGTTAQEITTRPCNALEVGFSKTKESQDTRKMIMGQKTDFSDISLYPKGSITTEKKGALSFDKTMYLENFVYDKISKDRINKGLADDSITGRPSTSCNDVTTGTLDFPDKDGNINSYQIVNTQLGNSPSYCNQNNRALYIDLDEDGDYSEEKEGPYQDGEKAEIRDLTYTANIIPSTASGCGSNDCAGFVLDENPHLNIFTHNLDLNLGRAPYNQSYSSSDRKAIAAFIYTMGGPTEISDEAETKVSTSVYGSTSTEPFTINMRWKN